MARRPLLGGFAALVLSVGLYPVERAYAQQPARPNAPAPAPAPGRAPIAAPAAGQTTEPDMGGVRLPDVSDPMLDPLPIAKNQLTSWRQALRMLRAQATTVRTARYRVEVLRGQAKMARSAALPSLTGTAAVNHHLLLGTGTRIDTQGIQSNVTIPDPATSLTAGLTLRQPLFAPAVWNDIKVANMQVDAAELDAKDKERIQLAGVASAAVDVVTAERLAEVSRISLRSALSTLELTKRRAQLGASSAVDVLRAEQEVSSSRAQVVSADETARVARETLGLALGSDQPWAISPNVSLEELGAAARQSCRPVPDLAQRADLRAANAQIQIAKQSERSVDYSYGPTLDFNSVLGYTSDPDRSANGKHVTWTIGATLNWPLFDGLNRVGDRQRAEAETLIARENLNAGKRNALIQVVQANRAIEVAQANLAVYRRARDVAKESARLSTVAFVNGTGTSFDLNDTAAKLRAAEIDLAIREFELVRARITAFIAQSDCSLE